MERLTEDLLERLLACESPQEYLDQDQTIERELSDYLSELLKMRKTILQLEKPNVILHFDSVD